MRTFSPWMNFVVKTGVSWPLDGDEKVEQVYFFFFLLRLEELRQQRNVAKLKEVTFFFNDKREPVCYVDEKVKQTKMLTT